MLYGREATPENGSRPEPDEEPAPLSRNQPKENKMKQKNEARIGGVTYRFPKETVNEVEI